MKHRKFLQVVFIEMMGVPGSFDASVYDHFEDKDNEGQWFLRRFDHLEQVSLSTCNVCLGEKLPEIGEFDAIVLAGSYNSVHDNTDWQIEMSAWLPRVRENNIPILAVCGSHQLISYNQGASVEKLTDGPFAGTFSVELTPEGVASPLFEGIDSGDSFHYANGEHVTSVPSGATLLASSSRVPVAALDFGNHCYTTQFHPEGSDQTLGTVWRYKSPELMENYHPLDKGDKLVENFFDIAKEHYQISE